MKHHAHNAAVPKSPNYVDTFIKMAAPVAKQVKLKWGVPAAVLIAQAAQETG